MAPTDLMPSTGLRRAATAERHRIDRIRQRLEARQQRLRDQLEEVRAELAGLEERRQLLERVIGPSPAPATQPHAEPTGGTTILRGRELRERAAQILFARHGANAEIHYRRWLDDVLSEGYDIVAKDPPAAFLTTASRSPVVVRGAEPGTYRIDIDRAEATRRALSEAEAELADLAAVIAREPNPNSSLREHRTRLTAALRRLERDAAEIDRVLTVPDPGETDDEIRVYRAA